MCELNLIYKESAHFPCRLNLIHTFMVSTAHRLQGQTIQYILERTSGTRDSVNRSRTVPEIQGWLEPKYS